jgi:hypothetical protein
MSPLSTLRGRHRRWLLASDRRAGVWSVTQSRNLQLGFIRRNWIALATLGACGALLTSLVALFFDNGFLRGLFLGCGLTATAAYLSSWVTQATGSAPRSMGVLAERWTAGELRRLRRGGWHLVNHFSLGRGDVDHVLVGPGGAFAIETKWSATPWTLDRPDARVLEAVRQVEANARSLRLWKEFKAAGISAVEPVVVLWGTDAAQLPSVTRVDQTIVVAGPAFDVWRDSLGSGLLSPTQSDDAYQAMNRHLLGRDPRDETTNPAQPSVWQLTTMPVIAAITALIVAAALLRLSGSLYLWAVTILVVAAPGVPALKRRRSRLLALGWQTGLAFSFVTFIVGVLVL